MPDPMPPPVPPANSVPAQPARKKARWPWILGGCGCLTLIGLCIAAGVIFYTMGSLGKNMVRFDFGDAEWKRDSDSAFRQFRTERRACLYEVPGEKYNGVVHVNGYWQLDGDVLFLKFGEAWVDTGRGGGANAGKLSSKHAAELGVNQEQRRKLTWIDANTFKLTEHWWSSKGEIWRRQTGHADLHPNTSHYSLSHKVPERWVDGRGWVPERPEASSEKTPAPEAPVPNTAATADREAINQAAVEWLGLLDEGDYPGSFAAASAGFRKGLTPEKWKAGHAAMQKEFGTLVSHGDRVTLRTRTSSPDGGKPQITYILDIPSKFSKATGTEHITLVKESGEWKVADYSIEVKTAPRESASPPQSSAPESTNPLHDKDAKIVAAMKWLQLVDAGDYRASFAAASEEFQNDFGAANMWEITLSAMRNSSGAVVSRDDKMTLNTTYSGRDKPKVSYQLDIKTKFAKKTTTEEVTLVKEAGEWKVAKYRRKADTP